MKQSEAGDRAVMWLAISAVIVLGCAFCSGLVMVTQPDPTIGLCLIGIVFVTLITMVRKAAEQEKTHVMEEMYGWLKSRWVRPKVVRYAVRKRESTTPADAPAAPPRPPTAEELREIKQTANTWVPSRPPHPTAGDSEHVQPQQEAPRVAG